MTPRSTPPHRTDAPEGLIVPERRRLLRTGGTALVAAVLAACSGDDSDGDVPAGDATTPDPDEGRVDLDGNVDLRLMNTALSLELVLVSAYGAVLGSPLLQTAAIAEAASVFQGHHLAHRDALLTRIQEAGEEPFAVPNPAVRAALVDPVLLDPTGEAELVGLLHQLEHDAAQLYAFAAARLGSGELRATAMSIGGVESRHAVVLDDLGELGSDLPVSYPTTNPLPSDAIVPD